jgi:transcriptional regulator with XRE-family HTH domain
VAAVRGPCKYLCVPTLEGSLIAKWREHLELSQEELGSRCPKPVPGKDISRYEKAKPSLTLRTLVNVVRALGVPGDDDQSRLAMFFLGPNDEALRDAIEAHRLSEESSRRARLSLQKLAGRGRHR